MKRLNKLTDWILAISFIGLAVSGIAMHISAKRHFDALPTWDWIHMIAALIFTISIALHVRLHINWYKALTRRANNSKLRNRRLSVVIFDIVTLILVISGITLLFLSSTSHLGFHHYLLGVISIFLALWHSARRFHFFTA